MKYSDFGGKILLFGGGVIAVLFIVGIIFYLSGYIRKIKSIKLKFKLDLTDEEYRRLKRKLHTLYWCLIPGITPCKVNSVRKYFSRKKQKKSEKEDNVFLVFAPSFLGIMLCVVCLIGGTFAWFTSTQTVPTQVIQSANYSVECFVTKIVAEETENPPLECDTEGVYTLAPGNYTVEINATGTATTGYCIVKIGDIDKHTENFPTEDNPDKTSITFTLEITEEDTTLEIIPQWGSSAKPEEEKIYSLNLG